MNPKRFFVLLTLASLLFFGLWLPAGASSSQQESPPTPTPGTDGRIIYVVQAGDNCFRVAAINGITVEQLRQLNSKLDENCTLTEGQELLIGVAAVATATAPANVAVGTPTITPTPLSGLTEVCVLLFNDLNGDAMRQDTEPAIAGGAVSVTEANGKYSASLETVIPSDPTVYQGTCFSNVPEGTYNITMAIPDQYNPTMSLSYSLEVKAGDRAMVDFSAQSKDVVVDQTETEGNAGGASTGLVIFGIVLLLGGAGLGYYAWRSNKPESKLAGGGILKK
ncbi:MAG TPA: LysM peptidoglycan-binding domain-containing protein [Anaerolineales bacterium]|nr:LysM peptidoglycan-binding domain-containing protein [Anaerolineales bacterium]